MQGVRYVRGRADMKRNSEVSKVSHKMKKRQSSVTNELPKITNLLLRQVDPALHCKCSLPVFSQVRGYVDCMVKIRRAEHHESGRKHRQGSHGRLTLKSESAKRRHLDDTADLQNAGDVAPSRRRSSRETVRKRTKASELTAIARRSRTRQLPVAGSKRTRSSASPDQRGALHENRTPDTAPQEQLQVPGVDPDSDPVQRLQAEPDVSASSAQTQQEQPIPNTVSKASLKHSRLRKSSQNSQGQGELASEEPCRQRRTAKRKAPEVSAQDCCAPDSEQTAQDTGAPADDQPAQDCSAPAGEQPPDDAADEAQTQTPDSPGSQGQHSPKGTQKRTYCKRTHGTAHPTFEGVKTSTAGVKHMTTHPDVKQIWSAYVMVPSQLKHKDVRMLFLGKNYWSAEAAARAVDRANIALHGREAASTNFPLEWYGPEVCNRPSRTVTSMLPTVHLQRNTVVTGTWYCEHYGVLPVSWHKPPCH